MKCYELEKMIAFAADPVKPEHAEIASHITHCKSCQSDFELVLETIQQYNAEPLPGDAALAKDVTSAFLAKKNTWEKFQNFVEKTVNLFQEQIKKGSMFLNPISTTSFLMDIYFLLSTRHHPVEIIEVSDNIFCHNNVFNLHFRQNRTT